MSESSESLNYVGAKVKKKSCPTKTTLKILSYDATTIMYTGTYIHTPSYYLPQELKKTTKASNNQRRCLRTEIRGADIEEDLLEDTFSFFSTLSSLARRA